MSDDDEGNESGLDLDEDDLSDDDDDDDNDGETPENLYPDPLSLIDNNADLDAVLAAKTIGEAIQLLCPNMPGLPSKLRGKYKKRRFLTEDQKEKIMRARNRDNARRTRKRKKLYIAFLNNALDALEDILNPKEASADGVKEESDDEDENGQKKRKAEDSSSSSSSSSFSSSQPGGLAEGEESSSAAVHAQLSARLSVMKNFLSLRCSASIEPDEFTSVCLPTIVHSMPLPAHRDLSSLATISDLYECKGFDALVDDTRKRASFCDAILRWSGPNMHNWAVEADVDSTDVMLNASGDKISIQYTYRIYIIPMTKDIISANGNIMQNPPKELWKVALNIPVVCLADFGEGGLLARIEEQFDVLDIIRQRDHCAAGFIKSEHP